MRLGVLVLLVLCGLNLYSQPEEQKPASPVVPPPEHTGPDPSRLRLVTGVQAGGYLASMLALNQMWYSDHPRSSFHFHDDLPDWKQLDKMGHIASTYHIGRISAKTFRWSGMNPRRSATFGSLYALALLTTVEIMDGFSAEWGASVSDLAANKIGAGSFLLQELAWEQQRIGIKYSFRPSGLEQYRPDLLGDGFHENLLKDYNGMTFWASVNISSFLDAGSSFPSWLNLAVGYGADGLLGSRSNPETYNGQPLPQLERYRQWYLAPDIDLSKIQTGNPFLNNLLSTLNFLKMPSPALEYNAVEGWRFHWVFF